MKMYAFSFSVVLACFASGLTGCGGSGESTIVQPAAAPGGALPPEQQQSYEEAMKNQPTK